VISDNKKRTLKLTIAITILILILSVAAIFMIKYEVEGETNMPFKLSRIVIVGSAEGIEVESNEKKDINLNIYQNNYLHFYIDENNSEKILIKNVKIDNIQVTKNPQKGNVKVYMPNSEAGRQFNYDEQFLVENKLEYKGASQSSTTNLEIGSRGGSALICFSNADIGELSLNKEKQIIHDGTLLKEINVTKEEINFSVSFDFTIETTKAIYKANINLSLPTGNIGEEKRVYTEITDMDNIAFKRIKNY